MKATVAVIGATGKMGRGLSHNLARAGYRVLLVGHAVDKLEKLQGEIVLSTPGANTEVVNCVTESSWEADIIVPAVTYCHQKEVAEKMRDVVPGKIIIDLTNPLNSSLDGLLTQKDISAAEEMQQLLPHSHVVKAFNTVFAADFYTDKIALQIPDCFVAGDDNESVAIVAQLVRDVGFNPVIAGKLVASRTLESMMVLLIGIAARYNYNGFTAWKVLSEV